MPDQVTGRLFDLDDPGTEEAEQHPAVRAVVHLAEIEHRDP